MILCCGYQLLIRTIFSSLGDAASNLSVSREKTRNGLASDTIAMRTIPLAPLSCSVHWRWKTRMNWESLTLKDVSAIIRPDLPNREGTFASTV